jgi:hypothetical protein
MIRRWVWLAIVLLLMTPGTAEVQTTDLSSTWNSAAVVQVGPDSGDTLCCLWCLTSGDEVSAGTFRATISDESIAGSLSGTLPGPCWAPLCSRAAPADS